MAQVRHYVELAELRRVVLQAAVAEMSVLLREEAYRAHAAQAKMPSDSKMRCGERTQMQRAAGRREQAVAQCCAKRVQGGDAAPGCVRASWCDGRVAVARVRRDAMGRPDVSDDAQAGALSWLVPSLLMDNAVSLPALAAQAGCPARDALQVRGAPTPPPRQTPSPAR